VVVYYQLWCKWYLHRYCSYQGSPNFLLRGPHTLLHNSSRAEHLASCDSLGISKTSRFSVGFRGISRLDSTFIFLRWFKFAHICIQVTSLHRWSYLFRDILYCILVNQRIFRKCITFSLLTKCPMRAGWLGFAGRIWPADRSLENPGIYQCFRQMYVLESCL